MFKHLVDWYRQKTKTMTPEDILALCPDGTRIGAKVIWAGDRLSWAEWDDFDFDGDSQFVFGDEFSVDEDLQAYHDGIITGAWVGYSGVPYVTAQFVIPDATVNIGDDYDSIFTDVNVTMQLEINEVFSSDADPDSIGVYKGIALKPQKVDTEQQYQKRLI